MCGCERQPSYSASLKPSQGDPLGLKEGVTWIGRGDFLVSTRAQLLCSRRQACFKLTETGLRLECHGINPLLFVVCHSKNFRGTEATPAAELFQLRKGEAVELADGDQFYFAAMECLLTIVIRQNDIVEISRDALQLPLQQASEACVKEKEQNFIENRLADEQQVIKIPRELQGPAEDCGTSEPQRFSLKNDAAVCANSSKTVPALHCLVVAGLQEILVSSMPSGNLAVDCWLLEKPRDGSLRNDQDDSDSLGLDAYDCAAVGVSRFDVQLPQRREDISNPAVAIENGLNESHQICAEKCTEEALNNSTIDKVLEDVKCPQFSTDGEGCRPPNDRWEDCEQIETSSCSRDIAHLPSETCAPGEQIDGEGCGPPFDVGEDYEPIATSSCLRDTAHGLEDLPSEACAHNEQIEHRETEDYNPIMSSETIDGRSIEDEVLLSEPARGVASSNVGDCLSNYPNLDLGPADSVILSRSPVSGTRDECPERMEVEEHFEVSDRSNEREDDPVVSADVEDESWPDGPVEGMEPVIASVSGYEGVDRQKLVKLINKTGAAFTGVLSKANTHLVCWNFHGKKFDRAMKLHKVVINHQWFEDCLRAGKRLSEDPYKLRSGEDVGPLKWKDTPPPPVTEQAEPSNGATNQHLSDHGAFFSNTLDQEGNMGQQGQHAVFETTSYRKDLPGTSRQAGPANVEAGHTGGRKSRRLIKRSGVEVRIDPLTVEQENLVRENPMAPPSSTGRVGESYQRRTGESLDGLEQGYNTRRRKSASSALHNAGQAQGHDTKRRKSASSVLGRGIDAQEQGAVSSLRDNLTGRGRPQSSVAPDREFTVINLADDVDDDLREIGSRKPQAASAQGTEGTNADTNRGRSLQDSQSSQRDREVACAICLVEAKSPSEGLLECGHKFCYKCIFTWTIQAVKGPSCPLCKASCDFITRQEVSSSGKLDETVVVVGKKEIGSSTRSQRTVVLDNICIHCGSNDSESLLMRCGTCGNRAIHNFCMDPPAPPPWFCPGCTHGHHRDSMRLAWNQFLPGPSTAAYADSTQEIRPVTRPSNVRRRNTQPYTFRRPSRPISTYRPSLHTELAQSMGPVRRRNVVGQHSLRTWLSNDTSGGGS